MFNVFKKKGAIKPKVNKEKRPLHLPKKTPEEIYKEITGLNKEDIKPNK